MIEDKAVSCDECGADLTDKDFPNPPRLFNVIHFCSLACHDAFYSRLHVSGWVDGEPIPPNDPPVGSKVPRRTKPYIGPLFVLIDRPQQPDISIETWNDYINVISKELSLNGEKPNPEALKELVRVMRATSRSS